MLRMCQFRTWAAIVMGTVASGAFSSTLLAQDTAFGYQGQLKDGAAVANGNYNLVFRLYPSLEGGASVAPSVSLPNTPVSNGIFSAQLDFGAEPWVPNLPRWLEIDVNGQTLLPRVALTSVPSSLSTRGIHVDTAGRVGIGIAAPTARLEISGQAGIDGIRFPDGSLQTTAAIGGGGGSVWSLNGTSAYYNAGNVGIGSADPAFKLDTNASTGFGARLGMQSAGGGALVVACNPGDNRVYLQGYNSTNTGSATEMLITGYAGAVLPQLQISATKVGIGTATPTARLHVRNTGAFSGGYGILGETSSHVGVTGTANDAAGIGGRFANSGGVALKAEGLLVVEKSGDGAELLRFETERPWVFRQAYTGPGTALRLQPTVGLKNFEVTAAGGTTVATFVGNDADPQLIINGTTSTKVLQITGADLAERFPAGGANVEPGTVMEIDPEKPGQLRIAQGAYNQRVAGVVSGANDFPAGAILGHQTGEESTPAIALSGRVWVRCDAGREAIQLGDLLTTSDKPGHAMKASDRERSHGAVLGKAMTALKQGETALVLVLVNLQ